MLYNKNGEKIKFEIDLGSYIWNWVILFAWSAMSSLSFIKCTLTSVKSVLQSVLFYLPNFKNFLSKTIMIFKSILLIL